MSTWSPEFCALPVEVTLSVQLREFWGNLPGQAAPGQLIREGGHALLRFSNSSPGHILHPSLDFGSHEAQRAPIRCPTELSRQCSDALPVGGQVTADVRQMMMFITAEGSVDEYSSSILREYFILLTDEKKMNSLLLIIEIKNVSDSVRSNNSDF